MRMASSSRGSSPACCMRFRISRQESPASTRMRVRFVATTVLLPFEPLASTVIRIMEKAYAKRRVKPGQTRENQTTPDRSEPPTPESVLSAFRLLLSGVRCRCPLPLLPEGARVRLATLPLVETGARIRPLFRKALGLHLPIDHRLQFARTHI